MAFARPSATDPCAEYADRIEKKPERPARRPERCQPNERRRGGCTLDGKPARLSIPGIATKRNIFCLQPLHGFLHERVKPLAAVLEMLDDLFFHARRPEFLQMIGDPRHCLLMLLRGEKFADLIGHVDEFLR